MILQVEGLEFSYNSHPVLKEIKFSLERGQTLGLLGVNGAGKSTLLKCLNRILKPQRGVVMLGPDDLNTVSRDLIARTIGYVPQRHGYEQLTVFDAVLLGRKPHIKWQATEHDMAVVEQVIASMRLTHLAMRPVESLSGGESQKVVIARALAQEPEVLLLDEPTSSLDLRNQMEVMALVKAAVKERNLAAVISMHDLNLAFRHLEQVLLLKDGAVHAIATPDDIQPETIREVYGVEVVLSRVLGHPIVIPTQTV